MGSDSVDGYDALLRLVGKVVFEKERRKEKKEERKDKRFYSIKASFPSSSFPSTRTLRPVS